MDVDDQHRDAPVLQLLADRLRPDVAYPDDATVPPKRSPEAYAECANAVLAARTKFSDCFDAVLFSDPAFDMLLALFSAIENGRMMTTNGCCAASRVPRTTALRWIKLLVARGHVVAADDPADRRSTLLHLSETARTAIRSWLDTCVGMAFPL